MAGRLPGARPLPVQCRVWPSLWGPPARMERAASAVQSPRVPEPGIQTVAQPLGGFDRESDKSSGHVALHALEDDAYLLRLLAQFVARAERVVGVFRQGLCGHGKAPFSE